MRVTTLGADGIRTIRKVVTIKRAYRLAVLLYARFWPPAILATHKNPIVWINKNPIAWILGVFHFGAYAYRLIAPAIYKRPTYRTASCGCSPGRVRS